jgi:hypothetical protein
MPTLVNNLSAKTDWGVRAQSLVLIHMLTTGFCPRGVANGRNGCPVKVPRRTIQMWWKHFKDYGEAPATTKKHRIRSRKKLVLREHVLILKGILDDNPRLYLDECQDALDRITGTRYSIRSIDLVLKRPPCRGGIGYTRQVLEKRAMQASEAEQYLYRCCLSMVPRPEQLVFIDESHKSRHDGRRRYGYGRKGRATTCRFLFQNSLKNNYTLIAACDINGFVKAACRIVWAKHSDTDNEPTRGSVDSLRFLQWVQEDLVPTLGRYLLQEPRSVVVMDNASTHKDPRVIEAIEAVGAIIIWTAPYSPWLNPIEKCFSQYKKRIARVGGSAFGKHLLAMKSVTRKNMINYYASLGCVTGMERLKEGEKRKSLEKKLILLFLFALCLKNKMCV